MLIKYETFFSYISNHTGLEIKHLSDVENIFNSLTIQVLNLLFIIFIITYYIIIILYIYFVLCHYQYYTYRDIKIV